jgi:hypothetical protein
MCGNDDAQDISREQDMDGMKVLVRYDFAERARLRKVVPKDN